MPHTPDRATVAAAIMKLVRERGERASICPSEVARALADDWRPLMAEIRSVAADLMRTGEVEVTQRGRVVDPAVVRGPIRLRLARGSGGE